MKLRVRAWDRREAGPGSIYLTFQGGRRDLGVEGYTLEVKPSSVTIRSIGGAGLFYGIQTLRQLLPARVEADHPVGKGLLLVPGLRIEDKPRFRWRGLHLDVSRHFFPPGQIKEYIDYLAMLRMNVFHWHLVDDGGWRIEIKKYPKLTEIGAWRLGDGRGWSYRNIVFPLKKTGQRVYGGYYTQKEIRDIVEYARKRYVTIVPEIEMPGHSLPALVAYPELGIDLPPAEKKKALARFGGWENVYNAGLERTYVFLQDVLTEVMDLFPSRYIHVGGDEVGKGYWSVSPAVKALMKRKGLKSLDEVQSYFIHRMDRFLTSHGRRLVGWDEILQGGLSPNATVMSWRGIGGGIQAARMNHDVVMTPTVPCYIQRPAEAIPARSIYLYDPVPAKLTTAQASRVLGVQACIWTEFVDDFRRVQFLLFPRVLALAETAWLPPKEKDLEDFRKRARAFTARPAAMGVGYGLAAPEPLFGAVFLEDGVGRVAFRVPPEMSETLRYTIDGKPPAVDSLVYEGPVRVTRPCLVKAAFIRPDGSPGPVTTVPCVTPRRVKEEGLKPGLAVSYAEGEWLEVPDFGKLNPVFRKIVTRIDVSPAKRRKDFALWFEGFLKIPRRGVYTFRVYSDDGARLSLSGAVFLDTTDLHGFTGKKTSLFLEPGIYPFRVGFFQAGGRAKLKVTLAGPGLKEGPLPKAWLLHR